MTGKPTRLDLLKKGSEILRRARCDAMTGAVKDRNFRRNKRAESKRLRPWQHAKRKRLRPMGPASAVRTIPPEEIENRF